MNDSGSPPPENHKTRRRWKTFALFVCIVPLLLMVISVAWWYRVETPETVFDHFRQLERVEFLTVFPDLPTTQVLAYEGLVDVPLAEKHRDRGFGHVGGYVILDRRMVGDAGELIQRIVRADRLNNTGADACFAPRHAIRDPSDPDSYLLICFQCHWMQYEHGGLSGAVRIDESQKAYFNELADSLGMERSASL